MVHFVPAAAIDAGTSTVEDTHPTPLEDSARADIEKKNRKKKDKIRSAWIAFVGRIVAQLIGAATPIVVGVVLLNRYQIGGNKPAPVAPAVAAATTPAPARVRRTGGELALAVLPLQNFSGDARQDSFADGMTEALTADLAQVSGLRVISRTSAQSYRGQTKPLTAIARELDVDLLMEGSVVRDGDRVRVTAELIDAATDEHLWARRYDRTARDLLALQGEIASAIAAAVDGIVRTSGYQTVAQRAEVP